MSYCNVMHGLNCPSRVVLVMFCSFILQHGRCQNDEFRYCASLLELIILVLLICKSCIIISMEMMWAMLLMRTLISEKKRLNMKYVKLKNETVASMKTIGSHIPASQ